MREQQPSPHLTRILVRIFAAVPNMQAIRVICESGAAGGPRPARPRGETATVCVCVRARDIGRHGPRITHGRACVDAVAERARAIQVTDALAERLP